MSQLAGHSRDRQLLYSTLGGLQPGGMCLAWVAGATICEALRLTQRFDPETSWDKRIFVYFSLFMSVTLISLFQALVYWNAVVNYGQYRKLIEITDIFRFDYMATRIATLGGFLYYSYDVWRSDVGKIKIWKLPTIKVFICVLYVGVTGVFIRRIISSFAVLKIAGGRPPVEKWPTYRAGQYVQLIEGAVLTFLKAYDLVKSGAVEKLLGSRDDSLAFCWNSLCCLCQTAIFPTVFDLIAVSLPAPNGVSGTAYALSSISAELHLFGPIVAISAALGDMTLPSDEPCCSLENCLTREMNQTSQSVGDSNQERPVTFKTSATRERQDST
ncbi:hypothetical protein MJO28_003914 [Puccinia striiformis f. sp. tritici]|uniref:Uncharacterized protein n=1 Tax=Puccinia striiformis f. sp. tritici TaxID=168172 RepID=A0ACC0EPT7_9BASI|nr:hypothetical protein Pst134EA_007464 [Puccinia striiformis f. sp. tritici]KAH9460414.1 hypothetical protein Pst134EB_008587 [Puccinia striiformis f. sp. tritici]KAH9470200.1 hypothetical protein Pst134EA_007464 [Puccinia striiformis f. sp. tritici]KAI7956819.1 hypothetical protein MJO28_003914 [Puccinia striiformis f. sp. tritici]KAI7963986.1 hypothetical protein MJO29_004413 [Puccinia striiformis f. sp. tritici]